MQKADLASTLASLNQREQQTRTDEAVIRNQQKEIQTQLSAAQAEALKKHGTSDLAELRSKYSKSKEADTTAVQEYEQALVLREEIIRTINESVEAIRLG
ncbi:hypothetical protein [Pseudomonas putida]|uniref:Uncharacterized protein n=1 Tax=Pseudomonas putida TaxID=303 RepID=A0A8I1ECW8_PSEPU|nr:hypothetical protein [Pseudomonas putida]MBI6882958.1 hypothetical protein [Pseudomonas putida]